jgi:hypothetical protein
LVTSMRLPVGVVRKSMVQIFDDVQAPFLYCWIGCASTADASDSQPRHASAPGANALAFMRLRAAPIFVLMVMRFSF